jgi:tetratricopeptide (TPR) repeat protein
LELSRDERLERAIGLREAGQAEQARDLLLELAGQYPGDPAVLYQCAWAHDVLGLEREAVPFYERALAAGLAGDDRRGALLGLGSTYRTLGRYADAAATLRQGAAEFPEPREFEAFLAIALYNLGEHAEAVELLLRALAETSHDPQIARYRRALLFYAANLDRQW